MSKVRQRVYAHVKQDRLIIADCDSASPWAGSTDVSALTTSTNHREGSTSISFAKSGTTATTAVISRAYDTDEQPNLVEYYDSGELSFWINLSDLTNIASVSLTIGESASHNYVYTLADTGLVTGWQKVTFDVNSPTSATGDGAAWSSIGYVAVTVTFDGIGNTLAGILLDAISIKYTISTNVENITLSGAGLATEAKQDSQITQETATNTVLGATGDAAVSTDTTGTISGKLRGLVKIFADVWNSVSHFLSVSLATTLSGEDEANTVFKMIHKKLAASTYAPLLFQNLGANATLNVKASTGNVYAVACHNLNGGNRYTQLHATATVPGGGAVPAWTMLVPPASTAIFGEDFFSEEGINFVNGIAFAFSTTEATYTAATAADQMTHVVYI